LLLARASSMLLYAKADAGDPPLMLPPLSTAWFDRPRMHVVACKVLRCVVVEA
jgi:hypothetical protein